MNFVKNLFHKFLNRQISAIYNKRFQKYYNTPKGVFWNSSLSQDLRLNIILNKITKRLKYNTFSLADVGCGYGRLFEIIKERNLDKRINYYGFDINKEFVSFCSQNNKFEKVSFGVGTYPSKHVDFIVMSGTYNLAPTNNKYFWENYIITNLRSNWALADKGLIFNCLINEERQIKNKIYYTELSWIKKICEDNFGKTQISKHNLLNEDITVIIEKLT